MSRNTYIIVIDSPDEWDDEDDLPDEARVAADLTGTRCNIQSLEFYAFGGPDTPLH